MRGGGPALLFENPKGSDIPVLANLFGAERTVYFRTINNMNLQRLKLADLSLEKGAPQKILPVENNSLPWFNDAAHALL